MKLSFKNVTAAAMAGILAISGGAYYSTHESKVYAAGNNISRISNPKAPTTAGDAWTGNWVYFGRYSQSLKEGATSGSKEESDYNIEPIKWRILDTANKAWKEGTVESNGFAYNLGYAGEVGKRQNAPIGGDGMLLMSDMVIGYQKYHSTRDSGNEKNELCWAGNAGGSGKGSTLWAWLNGYGNTHVWGSATVPSNPFITTAFSEAERSAIMDSKVYSEDLKVDREGTEGSYAGSPRTSTSEDKVFAPSQNEMTNMDYGFWKLYNEYEALGNRTEKITDYANGMGGYKTTSSGYEGNGFYWLRSPGYGVGNADAADVNCHGYAYASGSPVNGGNPGVSPALNLNLQSVIFASKADGSDKLGTVGTELKKFVMPEGYGNEFKLTMKDESRKFAVDKNASSQKGNKVTIAYTGAQTGENEYISCLIVDKNDASDIKYYGKLAKAENANGTVDLILPSDVKDGNYVIKIFNEQCNAAKETDWASEPVVLEIDSNGQVGFPYSTPSFPNVQRIDILPASHSKSKGAQDTIVTLTGENFSSSYKVYVVFKKKASNDEWRYPQQGAIFLDSMPNSFSVTIPKSDIEENLNDIGKYTVQVEIESN